MGNDSENSNDFTDNDSVSAWLIRLLKGAFIGSAFIVPGMSGGALAAVFGLYERMIMFMASITKDFKKNMLFFLPVGIGGALGIFIFAVFLSFLFEMAEVQLKWLFIGCIAGTIPSMWKQAKRDGRRPGHIVALALSFVGALLFLRFISDAAGGALPLTPYTWAIAGAITALGAIVPGLSSSNLLLFLQMYHPMLEGIAGFDLRMLLPFGTGGFITILIFARFMALAFKKAYGMLFHSIIGFVLASTALIVPLNYNYLSIGGLISVFAVVVGILLALWICRLEERYRM